MARPIVPEVEALTPRTGAAVKEGVTPAYTSPAAAPATLVALPLDVIGPVRFAFVVTVPAVRLEAVPLALVRTIAEGVPRAGVVIEQLVVRQTEPLPLEPVHVGAVAEPAAPVLVRNCGVVVVLPASLVGAPEAPP